MTSTLFVQRIFAIYDFILQHQCDHRGHSPTLSLMADQLSMNLMTLRKYLGMMHEMGMIERAGNQRGIKLIRRQANWNALVTPEPDEFPPRPRPVQPPMG